MLKMISLVKSELEYNLGALTLGSMAIAAGFMLIKIFKFMDPLDPSIMILNFFLILIIGNAVKMLSEKRTRKQVILPVSPATVAISRLVFFVLFQLSLTLIILVFNIIFPLGSTIVSAQNLILLNIQFMVINTFIMLHNSLGFFNRFKYRLFLYLTPVAVIGLMIIFFQQVEAFFTANPINSTQIILGSLGLWLFIATIYVITFVNGKVYTE